MHFVHITPEQIKKHPWLGLLFGLFGMVVFTFLSYNAVKDYLDFSRQRSPELVDVERFVPEQPFRRKWVTLTNFRLDCDMVEKTGRTDPLDKMVSGPVYDTYTMITDNSGNEL